MGRAILYVDGFNFYYGVRGYWRELEGLAGLGWCDLRALIERHFPAEGKELRIKYFTAPVSADVETPQHKKGEHRRYALWRRALEKTAGLQIVEGFYQRGDNRQDWRRRTQTEVLNPDAPWRARKEKQTDVNLAVEVMLDCLGPPEKRPGRVYLLSDDADLMPVVFALRERIEPRVEVKVLLPSSSNESEWSERYGRTRDRLLGRVTAEDLAARKGPGARVECHLLTKEILANSLQRYWLQDEGAVIECISEWKLSTAFLDRYCRRQDWRPDRKGEGR